VLVLRAFRWGWADEPTLQPIATAEHWPDQHDAESDLARELDDMEDALRGCPPRTDARVRIRRVATRNVAGLETSHFATWEPAIIQVTVEALVDIRGLGVQVQLRDVFDRRLSTTRLEWQTDTPPNLAAGVVAAVSFTTDRLLLGTGYYQLCVGCYVGAYAEPPDQWVDGAWKFEVLNSSAPTFVGLIDLDLRYAGMTRVDRNQSLPGVANDAALTGASRERQSLPTSLPGRVGR
jgi:hypothetical protein